MEDNEMKDYRAAVEIYARNGIDYLFHNKGDMHALIILTNIFKNSKERIRIAANKLFNDEVVNTKEYVESMKSFLDKKDTFLDIIVSNKPSVEEVKRHGIKNTLYWMIFNHPAYRQKRVIIKEGGNSLILPYKNELNFCTGDMNMYRFETDIKERKALANFMDRDTTGMLVSFFDAIFKSIPSSVDLSEYYCNQ